MTIYHPTSPNRRISHRPQGRFQVLTKTCNLIRPTPWCLRFTAPPKGSPNPARLGLGEIERPHSSKNRTQTDKDKKKGQRHGPFIYLFTNLNYKVITLHVNEISVKERQYFIRESGIVYNRPLNRPLSTLELQYTGTTPFPSVGESPTSLIEN